MRVAYADPPYVGQAKARYQCAEIDHAELIKRLDSEYDAWALSCSSPSLPQILQYCPPDIRIAAWVKPFCVFKPNVNPAYAWEPVIFKGARKRGRTEPTVRDWVQANIILKRGLCGAKPEAFSMWLFNLLGLLPTDDFQDLFIGTGAVTKAWEKYSGSTCRECTGG